MEIIHAAKQPRQTHQGQRATLFWLHSWNVGKDIPQLPTDILLTMSPVLCSYCRVRQSSKFRSMGQKSLTEKSSTREKYVLSRNYSYCPRDLKFRLITLHFYTTGWLGRKQLLKTWKAVWEGENVFTSPTEKGVCLYNFSFVDQKEGSL